MVRCSLFARPLLRAEWCNIIMANYAVDDAVLAQYVPRGSELDKWNGEAYLSVVGFRFNQLAMAGVAIPGAQQFEEINLRFYVRRQVDGEWRRGVVFVSEFVPRRAVVVGARLLYNESYSFRLMTHAFTHDLGRIRGVEYCWRPAQGTEGGRLRVENLDDSPPARTEFGEFILGQSWGYSVLRSGAVLEYRVVHPPWIYQAASDCEFDCDVGMTYGDAFVESMEGQPASAFFTEGSRVEMFLGRRLGE